MTLRAGINETVARDHGDLDQIVRNPAWPSPDLAASYPPDQRRKAGLSLIAEEHTSNIVVVP